MSRSTVMRLLPAIVFAGLMIFFALALSSGDPSRLPSALVGKPVPATSFAPIEGLLVDGRPVPGFSSADLAKGKVSVVNFWASWCGPCEEEHPLLSRLKQETGADIYGVNYKDQVTSARRFLGRFGDPFTAVGTDPDGRAAIDWGVYGMPETFVIDAKGMIAFKHVGAITDESLEATLKPAIEKAQQQAGAKR